MERNYKESECVSIPEGFRAMPERSPGRCDFRSEKDHSTGFGVAPLLMELCKRLEVIPVVFPIWHEKHEYKERHLGFAIFNCGNCTHWNPEAETCRRDMQGYKVRFGSEKCVVEFDAKVLPWQEGGDWYDALVNRIRRRPPSR